MVRSLFAIASSLALVAAQLSSSSLETFVDSLALGGSFNPVKEAYWTGLPHHRRTPFAVSPDGKSAFLAYLDSSETGVHVQGVDPSTFKAVGDVVTVKGGKEAGGLVAHNDGFALLTNELVSGDGTQAIPVLYRYTSGKETFRTLLGGKGVDTDNSLASPDINGDLVFSEKAGYYAAYIVVTSYSGSASGHFGDAIRYITKEGKIEKIPGASSSWGCSHNTGIAFEEADAAPFASICAEDQGAIWLNTETQGMGNNGVKISNEHVINGASNEPMGGMSGSYSSLARFAGSDSYIFSWVSRGAKDLTLNDWMGAGYTKSAQRTENRNVAVAVMTDKKTLLGEQATSQVGAADGDKQVNWITQGANDCSNAHAAAFSSDRALITWEEISSPKCTDEAMGCSGTFAGTKFQLVDGKGAKVGEVVSSDSAYVAGDMVTVSEGRICWPYVNMKWSLSGPVNGASASKISFACMNLSGSGSGSANSSSGAGSSPAETKPAATQKADAETTAPAAQPEKTVEPVDDSAAAGTTSEAAVELPSVAVTPGAAQSNEPAAQSDEPAAQSDEPAAQSTDTQAAPAVTSAAPASGDDEEDAQSGAAPAATSAPASGDDEDCEEEDAAAESGAAPAKTDKPSETKQVPRPTGTRGPGVGQGGKTCVPRHTVTKTVYVTASAAPYRF